MTASGAIDLAGPEFWITLAVAALLLLPLGSPLWRRTGLALANLGFIAVVGGVIGTTVALALAALIWYAARNISLNQVTAMRILPVLAIAIALLFLFLFHKRRIDALPGFDTLGSNLVASALVSIGYSYVVLRATELLKAASDDRARGVSFLETVNYLLPFNMLAAGPIQSWDDFRGQPPAPPAPSFNGALTGFERIAAGLFKKFVIAQGIERLFLTGFTAGPQYSLFEMQMYYLWVYLDFSAYTDIAVGAGILLGVATPENFRNPLAARNIIVFWERWHISLSAFARRNIFTPFHMAIGRMMPRVDPLVPGSITFLVTFLAIAVWHSVSMRFVLWGVFHASALIACNLYGRLLLRFLGATKTDAFLSHAITRTVARVLTFEFVAWTLMFIVHPATSFLDSP